MSTGRGWPIGSRAADVKLKKFYSSREVATLTGLSARQLQWWDARRLFTPAVAPRRTAAGGFTERRYTPLDVLELQVLGDLRRRGFSVPRLRRLLTTLRQVFGVRLYEAIGEDGPLTLTFSADNLLDAVGRRAASVTRDFVPLPGRDLRVTARFDF